jgi:glycerol-3-phosphate responsive antiterminator
VFRDWAEMKNYINSPVKILLLVISSIVALSTIMQALLAIRPPTGH